VTASVALACFSIFGLVHITTTYSVIAALAEYGTYSITYEPASASLRAEGLIGQRFDERLAEALAVHPNARTLVMNSEGGLIDNAMAAARLIETRKLTIVVRDQCSSACLIVFAAGAHRRAHWNATFGFHAVSPVLAGARVIADVVKAKGEEADDYMVARGVPREIIDEANRRGPQSLYLVPTVELVDRGFVHSLFDGEGNGRAMALDLARWRTIEELLFDENWDIAEIFRAIREAAPDEVAKRAASLVAHSAALDESTVIDAARRLALSLRHDALRSADQGEVVLYAQVRQRAIDALAEEGAWQECAGYVGDETQTRAIRSPLRLELAAAFGRLIGSASRRGWKETSIGANADADYRALKADADLAVMAHAVEIDESADEARGHCLHAQRLARGANALEPHRAADAFRYAESFGGWSD
jgi:hypothetical protein